VGGPFQYQLGKKNSQQPLGKRKVREGKGGSLRLGKGNLPERGVTNCDGEDWGREEWAHTKKKACPREKRCGYELRDSKESKCLPGGGLLSFTQQASSAESDIGWTSLKKKNLFRSS